MGWEFGMGVWVGWGCGMVEWDGSVGWGDGVRYGLGGAGNFYLFIYIKLTLKG